MTAQTPAQDPQVACPVAARCGGCALIELPYEEQLRAKNALVADAFARYPELAETETLPIEAAPRQRDYRTRARFSCEVDGGAVRIGLRNRGTVVDVESCPVLHPGLREVLEAVRTLCVDGSGAAPVAVSLQHTAAANQTHLTLVAPDLDEETVERLAARLSEMLPRLAGVSVQRSLRASARDQRSVSGVERLEVMVENRRFELAAGAFFQPNPEALPRIVRRLREHFAPFGSPLVDVYCGVGTLSVAAAPPTTRVVAIDNHGGAAQAATEAARAAGFADYRVLVAPAERALPELAAEIERADGLILNPPRRGCPPRVLQAVAALGPRKVAYLASDPSTLARDLATLARLGLVTRSVLPFDLLPQTREVEVLALLEAAAETSRGERRPKIEVLYEDDDLIVVDKPPLVAVHAGSQTGETILDLLAQTHGDEARRFLLVHRLDAQTSGALVIAKHRDAARRLSDAFAGGHVGKRYVCLVRGIARKKGVVNRPIGDRPAQPARTKYRQLMLLRGHALLAVTPETGRKHQIRRHMEAIHHPIVGDKRYGDDATNRHFAEHFAVSRLLLHAVALSFEHPSSGETVGVTAPIPGDFATVLAKLGCKRPLETQGLLSGLERSMSSGGGVPSEGRRPRRRRPPRGSE